MDVITRECNKEGANLLCKFVFLSKKKDVLVYLEPSVIVKNKINPFQSTKEFGFLSDQFKGNHAIVRKNIPERAYYTFSDYPEEFSNVDVFVPFKSGPPSEGMIQIRNSSEQRAQFVMEE